MNGSPGSSSTASSSTGNAANCTLRDSACVAKTAAECCAAVRLQSVDLAMLLTGIDL